MTTTTCNLNRTISTKIMLLQPPRLLRPFPAKNPPRCTCQRYHRLMEMTCSLISFKPGTPATTDLANLCSPKEGLQMKMKKMSPCSRRLRAERINILWHILTLRFLKATGNRMMCSWRSLRIDLTCLPSAGQWRNSEGRLLTKEELKQTKEQLSQTDVSELFLKKTTTPGAPADENTAIPHV